MYIIIYMSQKASRLHQGLGLNKGGNFTQQAIQSSKMIPAMKSDAKNTRDS